MAEIIAEKKQGDEDGSKRVGLFGFEAENKKILHS
jgi:hypothetical protein